MLVPKESRMQGDSMRRTRDVAHSHVSLLPKPQKYVK